MRTHFHNKSRGQVLVMVTLALFAMFGMLGLVVDLGWSYFVRKSAQSAADSAALAAVKAALDATGGSKSPLAYTCGGTVSCTGGGLVDCPGAGGNLASACLYAQQNGFTTSARQHVTVVAGDQSMAVAEACGQGGAMVHHPPTTGCLDVLYWVTVRVAEQTPQLFSAILGNTTGLASARATAAVAKAEVPGALFLLGRGEPWNPDGRKMADGTNLFVGGGGGSQDGGRLIAPPGINLASSANNSGDISGSGVVIAGFTNTRGNWTKNGSGSWIAAPTPNVPDGELFMDPYRGLGQPPLTSTPLTPRPVMGGSLSCNPCLPGNYFAATTVGGKLVATGNPIVINSDVIFDGGSFGDFNFFGGLRIGGVTATFGPGRYVIAGVKDSPALNNQTPLLNADNGATILSTSTANGLDAGRIFILTDSTYPGLNIQVNEIANYMGGVTLNWPGPVVDGNRTLYFSKSSFKAGNNDSSRVELYGLNETDPILTTLGTNSVGSTLKDFAAAPVQGEGAGVIFWQDQGNSYVKYLPDGNVDTTLPCTLNDPCMNQNPDPHPDWTTPQLEIWASDHVNLQGVIYQPRGAWTVLQANGDYSGPMRIVSGAMRFQGNGTLTMTGPSASFTTYKTALIE